MIARHLFTVVVIAFASTAVVTDQRDSLMKKADVVSVSGCLTAGPKDTWFLTDATDPALLQKKPQPADARMPATGRNKYRLIGLIEFDVPAHKGHTVAIKGLLIPGDERRINLTSLQHVAPTCPPKS